MLVSLFLITSGFILLIVSADVLVDGAEGIAKKFHIPEIIIGLTIVSIGTSMPELFISITSAVEGYSDMAIGNIIGSNLSNLLLILGLAAIIKPVIFQKETIFYEIPMCLFITITLIIFCNTQSSISRIEAIILLILFCLFICYTIFMAKKQSKNLNENKPMQVEENKKNSTIKNIIFILLGIVGLKFGGDLTVNNAVEVANHFGLSEKLISLTILAIGTSLPELVTTVTAAIKGDSDIAVGNIIGSNIFNMLLIIGTSAIIKPIKYNISYNFDFTILLTATILLAIFSFIPPKEKMSRKDGIIYLGAYIVYFVVLLVK